MHANPQHHSSDDGCVEGGYLKGTKYYSECGSYFDDLSSGNKTCHHWQLFLSYPDWCLQFNEPANTRQSTSRTKLFKNHKTPLWIASWTKTWS